MTRARLITAIALCLLCALQALCLLRSPVYWIPERIQVKLRAGESLVLGRQQLAAPQAAGANLALRRDGAGRWFVHDTGDGQPLRFQHGGEETASGSTLLSSGLRFQLGATLLTVDAAGRNAVSISAAGQHWEYDGAVLRRDGIIQPPCPGAHFSVLLVRAWNRVAPRVAAMPRPLLLGGHLHCGNRIGVPGTLPSSASIVLDREGPRLSTAGAAPLMIVTPAGADDLARHEVPLDQLNGLTAGRTRFALDLAGDTLTLHPQSHVALYERQHADLPPQVVWTWRARDPWRLPTPPAPATVAAALTALLLASALGWTAAARESKGRRLAAFAVGAAGPAIACAGVAALVLQRCGMPCGAGISLLLAWCGLWYATLAPRRFSMLAGAAVLLLAVGLLAQLELGLGAMESSMLRHFQKTAALAALGLGTGIRYAVAPQSAPASRRRFEWILLALAAVALAALALQVAVGGETGVFDLQPVEFAKTVLAALTAYCLAIALGAQDQAGGALQRWLRQFAPIILFVALLAVALVQVDDFSPLVLLLVWGGSMMLAWSLAARRRAASFALAGIACAGVLAVAGLRTAGAQEAEHLGFYADRFMVWLDPATHPHTGRQLLLGARAIADGGWFGADGLFGLRSLGQPAGEVLRVPEIQDDFAPSFFANRHGLAGVLALWALQALFMTALLRAAARAWLAAEAARDYRHAWFARFRCFALCGGAAFLFGHLLLSWGTNLSIFPVMGQPMSFLSAGGSHLLFFICPLLAIGAASSQSYEEI